MFRRVWSESLALAALVVATCAGAGLPLPALAQVFTQVRQERVLRTQAHAEVHLQAPVIDSDTESSEALGPFDRTSASTASVVGTPPDLSTASAQAAASQRVAYGPTSITGMVAIDVSAQYTGDGGNQALAISRWDGGFRVDEPTPFSLTANLRLTHLAGPGDTGGSLYAFNLFGLPDGGGPMVTFYTFGDGGSPLVGGERPVSVRACFSRASPTG
jgi:hypothetical protein